MSIFELLSSLDKDIQQDADEQKRCEAAAAGMHLDILVLSYDALIICQPLPYDSICCGLMVLQSVA